jgi:hypothetical protein
MDGFIWLRYVESGFRACRQGEGGSSSRVPESIGVLEVSDGPSRCVTSTPIASVTSLLGRLPLPIDVLIDMAWCSSGLYVLPGSTAISISEAGYHSDKNLAFLMAE